MKKILIFAALSIFIALACGSSASDQDETPDGKTIYEKYCESCHGNNGELSLNGAKKFSESTLNVEERILVITNGRNLMTPFKGILNDAEIEAVANYTMVLSKNE